MKRLILSLTIILIGFGWQPPSVQAAPRQFSSACQSDAASQACLNDINANPTPPLNRIQVDRREVGSFSFFRVGPNTAVYDSPGGAQIGALSNGFNYVIIIAQKDGYAQLRDKRWVQRSSLKQSYASSYSGVTLPELPYSVAWVIQAVIPSPTPGAANNPKTTKPIARYQLLYLYATVKVGQWDWFLVGPGQWVEQRKLARIMPISQPEGASTRWVNVDLYEQTLTAYEGNKPVFSTLISSGLPSFQTNPGVFKVWSRFKLTPMSGAMGQPDAYSLPAVPYVLFFDGEISLHGTYWHDGFGFKHSHGCVNMSITDAKWVYEWSKDVNEMTVHVTKDR
jgi:hypothetical protein